MRTAPCPTTCFSRIHALLLLLSLKILLMHAAPLDPRHDLESYLGTSTVKPVIDHAYGSSTPPSGASHSTHPRDDTGSQRLKASLALSSHEFPVPEHAESESSPDEQGGNEETQSASSDRTNVEAQTQHSKAMYSDDPGQPSLERPFRKVFGVGLSKTGSTSLGAAMTLLGYRNIHNDRAFAPFLSPPGVFEFNGRYDEIDSVEDLPTAFYYTEMLHQYPDALFILSIRDPESWYQSFSIHMKEIAILHGGALPFRVQKLTKLVYGDVEDNKPVWIEHYNKHNERVRATIPPAQLLEMDFSLGQGWPELCAFLQSTAGPCAHPQPGFVHENRKEWREANITLHAASIFKHEPFQHNSNTSLVATTSQKRYAYVSLVVTAPTAGSHNGNFGLFIRACRSIRLTMSKYEIVALILGELSTEDEQTLRNRGIHWIFVQPVGLLFPHNIEDTMTDLEVAHSRARIRALQLMEYDMVMVFHANLIFHRNCDDLFETNSHFMARTLSNTPFDTDLYLIKPSLQALIDLRDIANTRGFTRALGWLDYGAISDWRDPSRQTDWAFRGATTEQGLYYYYFFCIHGVKDAQLVHYAEWEARVAHMGAYHSSLTNPKSSLSRMLEWLHVHPHHQAANPAAPTIDHSKFFDLPS